MSSPQKLTLPLKKRQRGTCDKPKHRLMKRSKFVANVEADIRLTHLNHWKKHHFYNIALYQEQWKMYRNRREAIPASLQNKMKRSLKAWRKYYRRVIREKEKDECVYLLCCLRKSPIYPNKDAINNILNMISKAPIKY